MWSRSFEVEIPYIQIKIPFDFFHSNKDGAASLIFRIHALRALMLSTDMIKNSPFSVNLCVAGNVVE